MRKLIEVKQKYIKQARKLFKEFPRSEKCPIALAIKEIYPAAVVGKISYQLNKSYKYQPLSRSAQRFINKFDAGKPVSPFKFYINV